ncbi:MAG: HAD family hydrolase [Promethearchaeota archaeon]
MNDELRLDIFFDLHGVLIDIATVGGFYEEYLQEILVPLGMTRQQINSIHARVQVAWVRAFRALNDVPDGEVHDVDAFLSKIKKINDDWNNGILSQIPEDLRDSIRDKFHTFTLEYNVMSRVTKSTLFRDVERVLEELSRIDGIVLHVASSASSYHVRGTLEGQGIAGYFTSIFGYDTVSAPKKAPHGYYFEQMIKISGAIPEKSIFIGDSLEEATLSKKFGMRYVMVNRNSKNIENRNYDFPVITELRDILPIVENLIKRRSI